jgi:hypothetical protein
VPEGYTAEPTKADVTLSPGKSGEVPMEIHLTGQPTQLGDGELVVTAQSGARRATETRPLRIAQGAVVFHETRSIRGGAAEESRRTVDLACLENRFIRAEFIPDAAMLHSLIPSATGRDVLLEGDYPIGFGLYGGPALIPLPLARLSSEEGVATATFEGQWAGKPARMTATLGQGDHHVKLVYDFDHSRQGGQFYTMARVSPEGSGDTQVIPLSTGVTTIADGERTLAPQELAGHWTALQSRDKSIVLGIAHNVPALQGIDILLDRATAVYTIFRFDASPESTITFWLTAQPGDAATVEAWQASLSRP